MSPPGWLEIPLLVVVLIVAGFLSYESRGTEGLAGFGAGAALAIVLCVVSRVITRAARESEGPAVVRSLMGGMIVSFGTLIGSVLVVRWLFPRVLGAFALTAVSVYLVHRFLDAIWAGARYRGSGRATGETGDTSDRAVKTASARDPADTDQDER